MMFIRIIWRNFHQMHEHMNEDYLTMTHGQRFYAEQLEYLQQKNVDGLIENQYAPDAELLGFDFQVKGHEALRKHFHTYLETEVHQFGQ